MLDIQEPGPPRGQMILTKQGVALNPKPQRTYLFVDLCEETMIKNSNKGRLLGVKVGPKPQTGVKGFGFWAGLWVHAGFRDPWGLRFRIWVFLE